jgi:predicted nucleic acid-binding protein
MNDKVFIDTNLLIYYVADDIRKKNIVKALLLDNENIVISSQVINEFMAVMIRKNIVPLDQAIEYGKAFMDMFEFGMVSKNTIKSACLILTRYGFSYWDSLIIASALENNCSILCSEDMQAGQIIGNTLKIVNPFSAV